MSLFVEASFQSVLTREVPLYTYRVPTCTSTDLHPLSALQAGQDELAGKKEREEERRTQCEPKKTLQSHNHHTATDCIRRITFYMCTKN